MTDEAKQALVRKGADRFLKAEQALEKAFVAIGRLDEVVREGYTLDMLGGLQTMRMSADVHAAAGGVMAVQSAVLRLHRECTDAAIAHGVDVPGFNSDGLVHPAGGGTR